MAASAAFFVPSARSQAGETGSDAPIGSLKAKPATRKGNIAIGTNLGLANFSYGRYTSSNSRLNYDLALRPSAGIFVTDRLLLSANISAGAVKDYYYQDYVFNHTGTNLGVGMAARYYFGKAVKSDGEIKKLRFYAELGAGYMHSWDQYVNEWTGITYKYSTSSVVANGGAGISYFLSPNVAFDAGLNYTRNFPTEFNNPVSTGSMQLQFGFKIFLNRK